MKVDAGLQKSEETTKVATTAKDLEPSVFFLFDWKNGVCVPTGRHA